MCKLEQNKWQRMLVIHQYMQEKKGEPMTVEQVRTALLARGEEIGDTQNIQRDLRDLHNAGFIESIGKERNLRYKLCRHESVAFQGRLDKQDLFSFLLWSHVQQELFQGGAKGIRSMEKALAHCSKGQLAIHGKDLYADLQARIGGLVDFIGERSVRGPAEEIAPALLLALLESRKIQVEYQGIQDQIPHARVLEPWYLLVYKSELYFLCPDDKPRSKRIKFFKLARISSAKLTSERFVRDEARLSRELDRLHEQGSLWQAHEAKSMRIRLAFPWGFRQILEERQPHPSLKLKEHHVKEPWLEAQLCMPPGEDLMEWIRRWGSMVEVLSPKSLRAEMREYGAWLLEEYSR